jgi:hypothetical protein
MRRIANVVLGVAALVVLAFPAFGQNAGSGPSGSESLVIVFKDGHRQTVKMADVERIEFPGPVPAGMIDSPGPSRAHFLGKWEVGDGNGNNFFITLRDDGTAHRSLRDDDGHWQYVNGEAQIRWNDGSDDCIRKVGAWYKKFWYAPDQAFSGEPGNTANARNVSENPRGVD